MKTSKTDKLLEKNDTQNPYEIFMILLLLFYYTVKLLYLTCPSIDLNIISELVKSNANYHSFKNFLPAVVVIFELTAFI